jgi:polyisoprenoid-binding protein YceI
MFSSTEHATFTAEEWAIDSAHTQVGFSVKHLMITNVKGRFPAVSGTIRLDAHLRSADFLNVDQHPSIQFWATRLNGNVGSKFTLDGDLTIRGVRRPATLYVIAEGQATDPWGNTKAGFTATTTINRKDFGLEWNVALEAGGVLVGEEVRITIETQLIRQN